MNKAVIDLMNNNIKTNKEYCEEFVSTIASGNVNAHVRQDVVARIDTQKVEARYNEIMKDIVIARASFEDKDKDLEKKSNRDYHNRRNQQQEKDAEEQIEDYEYEA
ncbi:MAG: hypothetical protein KBT30_00800 [Clostridiales bacterium]|nr:hypothetical protein [Candidatus Apopatousia equi]